MYYDTKHNPADDPIRCVEMREPDLALPTWWNDVCEADFFGFDQWLLAHGAAADLAGVDFGDLCGAEGVDIRFQRAVRRDSQMRKAEAELKVQSDLVSERRVKTATVSDAVGHLDEVEDKDFAILKSFPLRQFVFDGGQPDFSLPGAVDLFSGRAGGAKQMVRLGCPWVLTFDWCRDSSENLLDRNLRCKVEKLIRSGRVRTMGAAPICASFSVAVTLPVRSARFPRGIPGLRHSMRLKVSQGNERNDWLADLVKICEENGVLWWIEDPDTSWWWRQKRWGKFRCSFSPAFFVSVFAALDAPGRRRFA
eukprot:s94_g92.t1